MSDSLWPHELQHTRLPCLSLSPGICSNSCPLSRWCYLTISSTVAPFSSCPQSFPASGSLPPSIRRPKYWSFSINLSNEYLGLISFRTDWFDLLRDQRVFSSTIWKHHFFSVQPFLWSSSYLHTWLLEKTIALTIRTFVGKVMSPLINILSRFVIAFLPRSKRLLILWLHSPSAVILEPKKICHCFHFFPSICHEVTGPEAMILVGLKLNIQIDLRAAYEKEPLPDLTRSCHKWR